VKRKIAIIIDKWKLKTFENVFNETDYIFEQGPGLTDDTLHFYVEIDEHDVCKLAGIVSDANAKAEKQKSKRWN